MALPPQAIERMTRDPSETQGAYKQLLLLSAALFILLLVLYFGIAFGYEKYVETADANVERELVKFGTTQVSPETQKVIADLYSQLSNIKTLIDTHTIASPLFSLLERASGPNAYFTKLNLNALTNEMTLTGAARSLDDAAAVANFFEHQPEAARVNFNNAAAATGGPWQFTLTVFLKPGVLHGVVPQTAAPGPLSVPTSSPTSSLPALSSSTPR